ncbi:MAG: SAM-dependent methyltransferase [Cyclobacteriaceae bacterium]
MKKGSMFLIPTYLSDNNDASFLAPMVLDIIKNTTHYLVENVRTSRRFISSLKLGLDISELHFEILDKKTSAEELESKISVINKGMDIGVISEAGLPGLADPGSLAVAYAHRHGIRVIPLPGATSIQTAIIASGFSGQQFTFHGYLPIQKQERIRAIKNVESMVNQSGFTQVFMETPFRNMSLFEDMLRELNPNTNLCVCSDIFGKKEYIKTMAVSQWKKAKIDLHKIPTVFCIGQIS